MNASGLVIAAIALQVVGFVVAAAAAALLVWRDGRSLRSPRDWDGPANNR